MALKTVAEVISAFDNDSIQFLFFWGHQPAIGGGVTQSCLSQWYDCTFSVDGVIYHTAEQYMMAQKAHLFGDEETLEKIMSANHPRAYKQLGRTVRGYNEKVWKERREEIVKTGNLNKFGQNSRLRRFLLETDDFVLVEASPYDRIWGIGMYADDPYARDPRQWRGQNLLGFALMDVRETLRKKGAGVS